MTQAWPVVDGTFFVGEPHAPVAVCTLTTENLPARLANVPGVAIAGQVYTANLGIERIILNVTANPSIRFLLLCGKESKLFRPAQSLGALIEEGVNDESRIVGAEGYEPVLPNVSAGRVAAFRRQIELVDWTGEDDPIALEEQIAGLAARSPGPMTEVDEDLVVESAEPPGAPSFVAIRPGGRRQPLQYDPRGYFVITIDREEEQVVLQHYASDHTPAHQMRGRVAESMFLGLLREDLVSQLSHAGYLGGELAKAEAALHLELRYRQDRPLTRMPGATESSQTGDDTNTASSSKTEGKPRISPAFTLQQFRAVAEGETVDIVFQSTDSPSPDSLSGMLLEPTEKSPFNSFHPTEEFIAVRWTKDTQIIMGELADVVVDGVFRVQGVRGPESFVDASSIVVLTKVATIE
jgi:tetrahydromethanopterin S-methyltransferase subunit A